MNITVNGETKNIADEPITITGILTLFNVEAPDMVSVQINGIFADRKEYRATFIKNNDQIDFLYFMGGGR
jgi:sulfur carrier protein